MKKISWSVQEEKVLVDVYTMRDSRGAPRYTFEEVCGFFLCKSESAIRTKASRLGIHRPELRRPEP